jgi:kinetochore protein NNF1
MAAAPATTSGSSSSAPAAEGEVGPAPSTSAVMDRRAATLVQAFNGAADATLKKISYENFAACFPTAAEHNPKVLERFWKDFTQRLDKEWKVSVAREYVHVGG